MQQEHRVAGAADRIVDAHAVDRGLAVHERGSCVVSKDERISHDATLGASVWRRLQSVD